MRVHFGIFLLVLFSACKKYLDLNPNSALGAPETLADYRALLDNNLITENSTPGLGQLGSDDYMQSYSVWRSAEATAQNAYIWQKDIYGTRPSSPGASLIKWWITAMWYWRVYRPCRNPMLQQ